MHRDIDTALLRAFVAVVETGSVTGAAALLNLTQAAVSQQLKRLEELFGTQLFERHHRRLALRPNGERLLAHAHKLIALNDEVWGAMSAPAYEGEVRLGVPHDIVGPYMPPILRRFDQAWPRVRVSLKCTTTAQLLELLRKGDLDLTFYHRAARRRHDALGGRVGLGRRRERGRSGRDPLPVSLGDEKCAFRPAVLKALRAAGRDWRPVCEVSSMEPLLASIEADLAIAPLLRSTIPHYLQPFDRDRRLPRLPKFFINLYLPPARQSEIALELARHISQEFEARSYRPSRNGRPARMLPKASPSGMLAG